MRPTHILGSLAVLQAAPSANANDASEALALVNQARQAQGLAPLMWNSDLTAFAQYWANQLGAGNLHVGHAPRELRPQQGETVYGYQTSQCNAAFETPFLTSMYGWLGEASQYKGQPIETGDEEWLHWSQCMWSNTTHIGCARAYSVSEPYKFYSVCRFFPEGNVLGKKPF